MSLTNTYDGVRQIVVDNLGDGSITVEPGSQQDLVEASIEADGDHFDDHVQIRHDHDWLRISFPQQFLRYTKAHLRLAVPDGLTYVIKTGSADISISADIGRSKIISGSGDITIGNTVDLDCSTGSGNISVARLDGSGAKLGSGPGDVVVKSVRGATLQANSGSGDIAVSATSGSVDLRSASGSLTVGIGDNLPAWLDLNSVSGDIRIGLESTNQPEPGEPYITVRARTASGDISIHRA
jgi:hypothetical protein